MEFSAWTTTRQLTQGKDPFSWVELPPWVLHGTSYLAMRKAAFLSSWGQAPIYWEEKELTQNPAFPVPVSCVPVLCWASFASPVAWTSGSVPWKWLLFSLLPSPQGQLSWFLPRRMTWGQQDLAPECPHSSSQVQTSRWGFWSDYISLFIRNVPTLPGISLGQVQGSG